jgi:high-affinity nickel-transport protein
MESNGRSAAKPDRNRNRNNLILLYGLVIAANAAVWAWALSAYWRSPLMLSTSLLAYGLGLRHAVDADHIAAIDNVTRKLMQDGKRPLAVGLFFAIGHALIVVIASVGLGLTATLLGQTAGFRALGSALATCVSAVFLFSIGVMNLAILRTIWATYRSVRNGTFSGGDIAVGLDGLGPLSKLLRPLFGLIRHSWQMMLVGFLFGLGFDTATEIALMGISATQAAGGATLGHLLIIPLLFAAGLMLVDTTDGVLMVGAYEWAFVNPMRKLYYNMAITLVSAVTALTIGIIEVSALIADHFGLEGGAWSLASALSKQFNGLGFAIIGIFAAFWLIAFWAYRLRRLDKAVTG